MKIVSVLGIVAGLAFASAAFAQTSPTQVPPAASTTAPASMPPAATTGAAPMGGKASMGPMDKKAVSKQCSDMADGQKLHGKARKQFRNKCKMNGGKA